jgi:chitinase
MSQSTKNLTVDPSLLQAKSQDTAELKATDASFKCCSAIKVPYRSKPLLISVWPWLVILMLVFGVQSASAQTTWSMGYYYPASTGGYPILSTIQWSALTHVIMVGNNVNSDGSITQVGSFNTLATNLIAAAHANNVKVLYGLGCNGCAAAVTNNLSTLMTNTMATVNSYGFDGVDVDDEETFNASVMSSWIASLRSSLGSKILTAFDVSAAGCTSTNTYTPAMIANLDRITVGTYDLNGSWNPETWFSSPLYRPAGVNLQSVDSDIKDVRSCGYPMAKVNIGIPFYGYLQSPSNGPYQSFGASPSLTPMGYNDIVNTYGTSGATYDSTAHVPWKALSGTSWLQWDDPQSITDKINYVQANNLGGWVIWVLGWDYLPGNSPQDPLLDAIGKAFSRPQPPTNLQIISVK